MTGRRRAFALNGVHLFVLSAFALAQPLFDILGRTPEFFVVRGSKTVDIVVLAVALLVAVPAALLLAEALVGLVSPVAASALHLVFVTVLTALIAMQLLKRIEGLDGAMFFAAAAAVGVLVAALYARRPALRTFLLVLSPAPVVFLALFLASAPLEELSVDEAEAGTPVAVQTQTPVVLVVFDELPVSSLMDARRRIDRVRYPNFASLADDATWFRNATTVHEHTTEAVPSILTGLDPRGTDQLPLLADHPQNLFTLLGGSYAMHVHEPVTQLCPRRLCPRRDDPFAARMTALSDDLAVVYGHMVLPDEVRQRLPSVTETWQDFGKGHGDHDDAAAALAVRNVKELDAAVGREMWRNQKFQFERYADSITRPSRPTVYFVHLLLPHSPWRYLPSGRHYGDALGIDGLRNGTWIDDEWLVTHGYQRHLLQVGFVDRLLGRLLRRLRAAGVYERSLIVVAADHGASFHTGERWRDATPDTLQDLAPVPLIVKRPNQRTAVIVDRAVRTTDIVPTIAEVLRVDLPRPVDGRSLFDEGNDRTAVWVMRRNGRVVSAPAATVERRRDAEAARKARLFGQGRRSLFGVGPVPRLIGRRVARLPVFQRPAAVEVDGDSLLNAVYRSSSLTPSHVRGHIDGSLPERTVLAIAVNGRIQAVTRSFPFAGHTRFAALVPEAALRDGRNDVQVYTVGARGGLPLGQLRRDAESNYRLTEDAIVTTGGRAVPLIRGALEGEVEDWYFERDTIRFGGWAGDVERRRLPDRILVFADDEVVYAGTTSVGRRDLARRYPGLGHSGFVFELPRSLAPPDVRLRFFALQGRRASELAYARRFPWRG